MSYFSNFGLSGTGSHQSDREAIRSGNTMDGGETHPEGSRPQSKRSYGDRLLDAMCLDEWKDAIDAEIDALDDAEIAAEAEEYEEDMLDRDYWAKGQW